MKANVFTYTGDNYPKYFKTPHWYRLKEKHIYTNPHAKCWVCEIPVRVFYKEGRKTSNLVPHHVSYDNLFHEKLGRDIYIICHECHNQAHYYKAFIFFERKLKLKRKLLLKRLRLLRFKYLVQEKRYGLAWWYYFLHIVS